MYRPDTTGMTNHKNVEGLLKAYERINHERVNKGHYWKYYEKAKKTEEQIIEALVSIGQEDVKLLGQWAEKCKTRTRTGYEIITSALGRIQSPEAADILFDLASKSKDPDEIVSISRLLWGLKDQRAFSELCRAAKLKPSLVEEIANVLFWIDKIKAMPYVIEALQKHVEHVGHNIDPIFTGNYSLSAKISCEMGLRKGKSFFSDKLVEIGEPVREPLLKLRKKKKDLLREEIDWILSQLDNISERIKT